MKMSGLLIICMYGHLSMAQTVEVQQLDEKFDVHKLKGDGIRVRTIAELPPQAQLPQHSTVLAFIEKIKANAELKAMDVLDQDLLYMRAHKMSTQEIKKLYPHFSTEMILRKKSVAI
ncbi:MAG: hypothetical protein PHY93_21410 [Bacteriovorax sp.]|nr:hypothetical protein [Bacteriovorax sp.]